MRPQPIPRPGLSRIAVKAIMLEAIAHNAASLDQSRGAIDLRFTGNQVRSRHFLHQ
jgi:hypothetical protein